MGGGGGGTTRPGTEKRCSLNLQSDLLGSGFKKGQSSERSASAVFVKQ